MASSKRIVVTIVRADTRRHEHKYESMGTSLKKAAFAAKAKAEAQGIPIRKIHAEFK